MAQRRMFSLLVTDTDAFLDMPLSTQALYFHLGMHGDDEGFVGSPRKIARSIGCNADDLKVLAAKGFIIAFESGVVVIRDWNINNTLRNDRFHPTIYTEEKALVSMTGGNRYELASNMATVGIPHDNHVATVGIPSDNQMEPELNITKHNITKPNRTKGRNKFVPPAVSEVEAYIKEKGYNIDAEKFVAYYESKGWLVGKSPMKNWKAAVVTWSKNNYQSPSQTTSSNGFLDILRDMEAEEQRNGVIVSEQEGDGSSPFGFASGLP